MTKIVTGIKVKPIRKGMISFLWDTLKECILSSVSNTGCTEQYAVNMLGALLNGASQAWAGYAIDDDGKHVVAFLAVTTMKHDTISGHKTCYINALNGHAHITMSAWKEAYDEMIRILKQEGVTKIETKANNVRTLKVGERMGFDVHATLTKEI